jgi:hypothetical protein
MIRALGKTHEKAFEKKHMTKYKKNTFENTPKTPEKCSITCVCEHNS